MSKPIFYLFIGLAFITSCADDPVQRNPYRPSVCTNAQSCTQYDAENNCHKTAEIGDNFLQACQKAIANESSLPRELCSQSKWCGDNFKTIASYVNQTDPSKITTQDLITQCQSLNGISPALCNEKYTAADYAADYAANKQCIDKYTAQVGCVRRPTDPNYLTKCNSMASTDDCRGFGSSVIWWSKQIDIDVQNALSRDSKYGQVDTKPSDTNSGSSNNSSGQNTSTLPSTGQHIIIMAEGVPLRSQCSTPAQDNTLGTASNGASFLELQGSECGNSCYKVAYKESFACVYQRESEGNIIAKRQ